MVKGTGIWIGIGARISVILSFIHSIQNFYFYSILIEIDFCSQYYGEWNPMLGILYVKLGKLQLNSNMFYPSVQNFTRGEDILKISHGRNHSIIDNQLRPMLMDAMRASSLMKQ